MRVIETPVVTLELFAHAFTNCKTTSVIDKFGKTSTLKEARKFRCFKR